MDYTGLEHFIKKKMRMTHVYQPLMIKTLLENGGEASVEAVARSFLGHDDSQVEYYKEVAKRWPKQTLKRHGIISYSRASGKKDGTFRLLLDEITESQRSRLVEICNLRLEEFVGKDPWIKKFRMLDQREISGSLRYDVLARYRGTCAACGATKDEARLHVDHIVPRNMGGDTEFENLQALCYRCNTQKRDRDDTNFMLHHVRLKFRNPKCGLCSPTSVTEDGGLAYLSSEDGRHVIAPHNHIASFEEMIPAQQRMCFELMDRVRTGNDVFKISFSDAAHCSITMVPA